MWYQVYAYGLPLLLTIAILIIDNIDSIPEHIQPNIGVVSCFISKQLAFFLCDQLEWKCEISIFIRSLVARADIFLLPGWHNDHIECDFFHYDRNQFPSCSSSGQRHLVKWKLPHSRYVEPEERNVSSIGAMTRSKNSLQNGTLYNMQYITNLCSLPKNPIFNYSYTLYLRLSVVAGISWCMELISFLISPKSPIFLITDLANTLHGVFIFIMFVVKRQVFRLIKERSVLAFKFASAFNNSGLAQPIQCLLFSNSGGIRNGMQNRNAVYFMWNSLLSRNVQYVTTIYLYKCICSYEMVANSEMI